MISLLFLFSGYIFVNLWVNRQLTFHPEDKEQIEKVSGYLLLGISTIALFIAIKEFMVARAYLEAQRASWIAYKEILSQPFPAPPVIP